MKHEDADHDLRALFAAQREDDAGHAPAFADTMARAQEEVVRTRVGAGTGHAAHVRRMRRHRLEWLGGLAAAAAIAALIVVPRLRDGGDAFEQAVRTFQNDPALGAWQSPTDGLLKLPGDGLLTTIPAIGTAQ